MSNNTIICMKWGTAYGPEYVNILYAMVNRHCTVDYDFICFTDDPSGIHNDIETRAIPDIPLGPNVVGPWRKLATLSPDLGVDGTVLFLDLDMVITGNMDDFFSYNPGEFCIIENWTQKNQGIGNSSVYRFEAGAHTDVFFKFCQNVEKHYADYINEQEFLTKNVATTQTVNYWPDAWCRSFKRHSIPTGIMRYLTAPKLPENCRILVFHGPPKPSEAAKGRWPRKNSKKSKFLKPAPWILNYWQE